MGWKVVVAVGLVMAGTVSAEASGSGETSPSTEAHPIVISAQDLADVYQADKKAANATYKK